MRTLTGFQGELYGNPHEEHVYHWKPEELEELGFRMFNVEGAPHMFGLKS